MRPLVRRVRLIVPTIAVLALLIWVVPAALGTARRTAPPRAAVPEPPPSPSPSPSASPSPSPVPEPTSGPGTWDYLDRQGPVLGSSGRVERFRVAVEQGIPYPVDDFAVKVD